MSEALSAAAAAAAVPHTRQPPATTPLNIGRWSFELRGDEVADIRYDGVLLLRAVRSVVRDQDWNTIPVVQVRPRAQDDPTEPQASLALRFTGPEPDGPVDYDGALRVQADEDELRVSFAGTARSRFRRNRIGLVALHPLSEVGREVVCLGTDGSARTAVWPTKISPHQPFRDVAGFRWERAGVAAELQFAGDVFETEDQRNWTDASFKTYSTPLDRPFPVEVRPGDRVEQEAVLRARRIGAPVADLHVRGDSPVVDVTDDVIGTVPGVSVGAGSAPAPRWAGPDAGFDTVLVELTGPTATWPDRLASATEQAAALGVLLDVRMVVRAPQEAADTVRLLDPGLVSRLAVFGPGSHVAERDAWAAMRDAARDHGLAATLLAGTRAHFAELNRSLAGLPTDAAGVTCSITPQMHATEIPHLVDSIAGQVAVAEGMVELAEGRPVWLGPVTLRPRFNAVATSGASRPPAPDPLQPSAFTAAWTLASVAALTRPGLSGLCYYELSGPRGLGDHDDLFPVGRLLRALARCAGLDVLGCRVPEGVAGYAVRQPGETRLFLARLAEEPMECEVRARDEVTSVALEPWTVTELCLETKKEHDE